MGGTYLVHQMVRPDGHPGGRCRCADRYSARRLEQGSPTPLATLPFRGPGGRDHGSVGRRRKQQYAVHGEWHRNAHAARDLRPGLHRGAPLLSSRPRSEDWEIDNASAVFGDAAAPSGAWRRHGPADQVQVTTARRYLPGPHFPAGNSRQGHRLLCDRGWAGTARDLQPESTAPGNSAPTCRVICASVASTALRPWPAPLLPHRRSAT